MRIVVVAGARPNFMKAAPLIWAAKERGVEALLIHTGQHYDQGLSQVFFDELGLPRPHRELGVGSGSHAQVTARCLERLEPALNEDRPDWVLVVGDVNSTLAGALCAAKLGIPLGHVEAGLRSFDRSMPEELNRLATDALSDRLFVSEPAGLENLLREGHAGAQLCFAGNVMIDTLERFRAAARERRAAAGMKLPERGYALMTLHRPSNVDRPEDLESLLDQLRQVTARLPLLFPMHPRTKARFDEFGLAKDLAAVRGLHATAPLGYLDFLSLMDTARVVLTDSGGIQEETTVLGVPCLTLRDNTERPVTVSEGTNQLVGALGERLERALDQVLTAPFPSPRRPELWDGKAAGRIIKDLLERKAPRR
jgi:UDP-N-acetylglucosamine 2-epimerase (non-hydrolysing)